MKKLLGGALPHSHQVSALLAAMIAAGALAGCVADQPPPTNIVVTHPAPPPARVEVRPPAPNATAVWQPGHWNWNGSQYVWVSGRYVEQPTVAMRWEPGHWMSENGSWVWSDGHWY